MVLLAFLLWGAAYRHRRYILIPTLNEAMKYFIIIILLFLLPNNFLFAQSDKLPKPVIDYILEKEEPAKKNNGYEINYLRQILNGDLNGDGKEDLVLKINILYGTEKWDHLKQYLAVFLFDGKKYKLFDEKEFEPLEHINGNFAGIELKELRNRNIIVKANWWGKDDSNCCPSISDDLIFNLSQNSLVSNKEIEKKKIQIPKIEDEIEVGNFKFCVNKIEFKKEISNVFSNKKADGIYLLVYMTVINITKESRTLTNAMFKVIDSDEYEFESSVDAINTLVLNEQDKVFLLKDIPPKIPKDIIIPFEVPSQGIYALELSGGFWTNKSDYILLTK